MKSCRRTALFLLLPCACLWLMASLPQNVAAETLPQPADSPLYFPSGDMLFFEVNPNWKVSYIYTLDEASRSGTGSFSKEEIAVVRKLVIERLRSGGLETRSYNVYMLDRVKDGVRPVYVLFDDNVKYIDDKSLDRMYFIRNNEIVFESVSNLPRPPEGVVRTR